MSIEFAEILMHPGMMLAMILALDLLFGDPVYRLHPVRLIGKFLTWYERRLRQIGLNGKFGGIMLVLLLLCSSLVIGWSIFYLLASLHWSLSWLWYIYLGWSLLALGDLLKHAKNVAAAIKEDDLAEAKRQVGMLVGRDTKQMDLPACGRAAVESVSENLNDGVIAPVFYFCFFGIPGMLFYKVVSTLDSMVGYRNERYQDFGWCGARFDDLLSWIPARLSWLLLSVSAALFPGLSGRNAFRVGWQDYSKLPSPNAGWSEAAAAGALKIKLCGPVWRDGELAHDYWLGSHDDREGATYADIQLMNKFALLTSLIGTLISGICLWFSGFTPFFST
ncbi:MAG: adenosylcobinamide-phosphate synthase CbiB [bacterium]